MDNKTKIIIGVVVMVVVCCCLLSSSSAGYWYFGSSSTTNPTPVPASAPVPTLPPASTPVPPPVPAPEPSTTPLWQPLGPTFTAGLIKDKSTDLCMAVAADGSTIISNSCDTSNDNQKWIFSDPYLKNVDKCLTIYSYTAQNKNPDGSYKLVRGDCTGTGWSNVSITGRHWKITNDGAIQSQSSGLTTPNVVTGGTAGDRVTLGVYKADKKNQLWMTP